MEVIIPPENAAAVLRIVEWERSAEMENSPVNIIIKKNLLERKIKHESGGNALLTN